MLESIYHYMTFKFFLNPIFGVKTLGFCHMCDVKSVIFDNVSRKSVNVISLSDATSYDKGSYMSDHNNRNL